MDDCLDIAGVKISNRLIVGTGKFPSKAIIKEVLKQAQTEVVTVALRRIDLSSPEENILEYIPKNCRVMVNTSGARNAKEALRLARLAKASGCGNWIKLEVIADNKYLLPDTAETVKATEMLADSGFSVFAYMNPDLSTAKLLTRAGAQAIMPLGSPIGSKRGVKTAEIIKILINEIPLPIIVDAGIGYPSDAAYCMEIGCAAVMVNTAIATAVDPIAMARSFSLAVKAGRLAYHNATRSHVPFAEPSSPLTGFLHESA